MISILVKELLLITLVCVNSFREKVDDVAVVESTNAETGQCFVSGLALGLLVCKEGIALHS